MSTTSSAPLNEMAQSSPKRLSKKRKADVIETRRGFGYIVTASTA